VGRCKDTVGEQFNQGSLHYALHAKTAREAGEEPMFAHNIYRARFHAAHA